MAPRWPGSRSPAEVLADALFVLAHGGFFASRERVAAAVSAVGLSMEDLRQAACRLEANPGRYRPPTGSLRLGANVRPIAATTRDPVRRPHRAHNPAPSQSRSPRPSPAPSPAPSLLTCQRCGREKPPEGFARRADRRVRHCLVCDWLVRRRRKYEAALGHDLLTRHTHTLAPGDPLLDGGCALDCGVPLVPGAAVIGVDVLVAHVGCYQAATALAPAERATAL